MWDGGCAWLRVYWVYSHTFFMCFYSHSFNRHSNGCCGHIFDLAAASTQERMRRKADFRLFDSLISLVASQVVY